MKTYFAIILLFIAGFSTPLPAQKEGSEVQNYIVITKNTDQLKPLILSAKSLQEEDGSNFGKFEVVICGKDIGDITIPEKIDEHLKNGNKHGVDIIACGFSMKRFGVSPDEVPEGIRIVENGILYNLRLQKQGFKSLGL